MSTPSQGRDALDYEGLVKEHYEGLYRFALGLSGQSHDAAELTQETYEVLLRKGGSIRDTAKAKSWLFTTLYRCFLKRARRARKWPMFSLEESPVEHPAMEEEAADGHDSGAVLDILRGLNDRYRAPLVLFYLEDLSYLEIAERLGIPIGTVMSRLSRGKQMIRQKLEVREARPAVPTLLGASLLVGESVV